MNSYSECRREFINISTCVACHLAPASQFFKIPQILRDSATIEREMMNARSATSRRRTPFFSIVRRASLETVDRLCDSPFPRKFKRPTRQEQFLFPNPWFSASGHHRMHRFAICGLSSTDRGDRCCALCVDRGLPLFRLAVVCWYYFAGAFLLAILGLLGLELTTTRIKKM